MVSNSSQALSSMRSRLVIDTILAGSTSPKNEGQPRSGIFVARFNYSFVPSCIQPINGVITFSKSPLRQLSMPHHDALVLTLEVERYLMKRILVDPRNVVDLLYLPALLHLGYKPDNLHNLKRVLVYFNISHIN